MHARRTLGSLAHQRSSTSVDAYGRRNHRVSSGPGFHAVGARSPSPVMLPDTRATESRPHPTVLVAAQHMDSRCMPLWPVLHLADHLSGLIAEIESHNPHLPALGGRLP